MALTEQQIALLRRSFTLLEPEAGSLSASFYEDLFRAHPQIRGLFGSDLRGQGMRFMDAVGGIVALLDQGHAYQQEITRIARIHTGMKITPEAYGKMETALVDTFRHALAQRFTPGMEDAWRTVLGEVNDAIRATLRDAA